MININGKETSKKAAHLAKTAITCEWNGPKYVPTEQSLVIHS
jgi:hypothetical protein